MANGTDDTGRTRQLPLDFGHDPATSRDDLMISDPLSAAVSVVDQWPAWPSPVVILAGPTGAGKSHLAAIWSEKAGAFAIDGASDDGIALSAAETGPVLIEDVDRAGLAERTLFHLINAVHQNGTSMLMTTRMWPSGWPVALPDLVSRLKAATVVEIGEPDDALLAQVIVKLFADRQVVIDERVVAYLVARMERSLGSAQDIVQRLDRMALARGSKITRAMAGEALEATLVPRASEADDGSDEGDRS